MAGHGVAYLNSAPRQRENYRIAADCAEGKLAG